MKRGLKSRVHLSHTDGEHSFSRTVSLKWNVRAARPETVSWYTQIQSGKGRCPWTSVCCSILCYPPPPTPSFVHRDNNSVWGGGGGVDWRADAGIWLPFQTVPRQDTEEGLLHDNRSGFLDFSLCCLHAAEHWLLRRKDTLQAWEGCTTVEVQVRFLTMAKITTITSWSSTW